MSATIGQTGSFPSPGSSPDEHEFPTLTPEQIVRVAAHGRARSVHTATAVDRRVQKIRGTHVAIDDFYFV